MAKVNGLAARDFESLQWVAQIHLEIVFPKRKFKVEVSYDVGRIGVLVVARFENHHGPQRVEQLCGYDCIVKDFRWSDRALTEMMLLE